MHYGVNKRALDANDVASASLPLQYPPSFNGTDPDRVLRVPPTSRIGHPKAVTWATRGNLHYLRMALCNFHLFWPVNPECGDLADAFRSWGTLHIHFTKKV